MIHACATMSGRTIYADFEEYDDYNIFARSILRAGGSVLTATSDSWANPFKAEQE